MPGRDLGNQSLASVLGVIRDVSVPLGMSTPGQPNVASTTWRTVSDQKNLVYYFDSATSPNIFWVELAKLDFNEGAPVKKLPVSGGEIYGGEVSAKFAPAQAFAWLPLNAASQPVPGNGSAAQPPAPARPAAPIIPFKGPASATKSG